jgi:hypothetical protein
VTNTIIHISYILVDINRDNSKSNKLRSLTETGECFMDEYIKRVTNLYINGQITRDEMCSAIAKKYVKLWARGQILSALGIE